MNAKAKRRRLLLFLIFIFWGMFPGAYRMAMHQRGKFAIGGEYCLFIMPFIIRELVFTLADMKKEAERWKQ